MDPEHRAILEAFFQTRANPNCPTSQQPYQIPPIPPPTEITKAFYENTLKYLTFSKKPIITQSKVDPSVMIFLIKAPSRWIVVKPYLVRKFIINPHLAYVPFIEMWIQKKEGGEKMPVHLPNIKDLQGLCPHIANSLRSWIPSRPESDKEIIRQDLLFLVDLAPILPLLWTSYLLKLELSMFMDSYNAMFLGHTNTSFHQMEVIVNPITMPLEVPESSDEEEGKILMG